MKLYKKDYTILDENDKKLLEELKREENIGKDGNDFFVRLAKRDPKNIMHYESLFPNNYVDLSDLRENKPIFLDLMEQYKRKITDKLSTESTILDFIKDNEAYFIVGSLLKNNYNFGHHELFAFREFPLALDYKVDYLLVGKNSDGYHFVFVEFEDPHKSITRKDGSFAETIRKGESQISDWNIWVEENFHILNETVFNNIKNKNLELPKEFRKLDKTRIHFAIVVGIRNNFKDKTRRLKREKKHLILHYENLVDCCYDAFNSGVF